MKTNFSLLFYLKKPKKYQDGPMPIYARNTIVSQRAEIATRRQCEPSRWYSAVGKLIGAREDARSINGYLFSMICKILNLHGELYKGNGKITAQILKDSYLGRVDKPKKLLEVIRDHNQRIKVSIGSDYAEGTFKRYEVLYRHTRTFLQDVLKKRRFSNQQYRFWFYI